MITEIITAFGHKKPYVVGLFSVFNAEIVMYAWESWTGNQTKCIHIYVYLRGCTIYMVISPKINLSF